MTFPDLFDRFAARYLPVSLSDAAILRFKALGRAVITSREMPVSLDENADFLVYVGTGATKLVAHASLGRDQVVAFHLPDELVAVPARAEHAYTLSTVQPSELLVFDHADFTDLARGDPAVLRILLDCTRKSLGRCRDKSLALGRKTAPERLAGFLVGMAVRIGVPQDDDTFVNLPMSRRDIADSLGLTIETVSRQFTLLRQQKVIETVGKSGVRVPDMAALESRAGYLIEVV